VKLATSGIVTLNSIQGPFLLPRVLPIQAQSLPPERVPARSGHAARWMLKQVQHDELMGRTSASRTSASNHWSMLAYATRHCEERSDEAIQGGTHIALDWLAKASFASTTLAMTSDSAITL
jgi:hypothetical protein